MSASKIILKRSSILGKRPSNHLQPGEIALNTNSTEPGLFFNTTDGRAVKVGPAAISSLAPINEPEKGELWVNTGDGTLNVGDAKNLWRAISSPYLGGGGKVVFVAPEFSFSSDSPLNDGQTLPFQTLTRASIEITKLKIADLLAGKADNKYVIIIAPSSLTPDNSPGTSLSNFSAVFNESSDQNVPVSDLVQFNAPEGGVIIPGNITLKGIDVRKCMVRPSFVPSYKHPGLPSAQAGINQSLSNIFKISGNSFCDDFSIADKSSARTVTRVEISGVIATFISDEPHGLVKDDKVFVKLSTSLDQSTGTFQSGYYYAVPVDTFKFQLLTNSSGTQGSSFIQYSSLPDLGLDNRVKFTVTNQLSSAHRLTGFRYATEEDLADYYTKVQKAFPNFFGGKVVEGQELVQNYETVIVAPTDGVYPENLDSNSTKNSSCYIRGVNLKSDYGMNLIDINGDDVEGYRSLITNECTSVSIQKDPAAYEIYTIVTDPETGTTSQKWWTLIEATYYSLPFSQRPDSIVNTPIQSQLKILNQTAIENIRYHYKTLVNSEGKSFGLSDIGDDFRHYGVRARNSAYIQAQSIYTIGCAIGVWSMGGAFISLTNSTTNFGSIAFKSEGFRGINTIGGAYPNAKGFQFNGIQRPLSLSLSQVLDPKNKKILSLGSRIIQSEVDPEDPSTQILTLSSSFLPCYILPYSLKPGSAIWVSSPDCTYRGFLATDGGPTVLLGSGELCNQNAKLRVRYYDSTIPVGPSIANLEIPYIRRFSDPRSSEDRSYQFVLSNTSADAIAPPVGAVLRLNQTSQNLGVTTLRPNVQLDPGPLGGWGRLFTVDAARPSSSALSPNYNYVVSNTTQDNRYLLTVTVSDAASPWLPGKTNNLPQGSYCTFANKNWYSAENNMWDSVYYDTSFSNTVSPYKLAPTENCSPFVPTNSLEKQELVDSTYQGSYGGDPNLTLLTGSEKEQYLKGSYFRGSTVPYTEYSIQNYYDGDDGSDDFGLLPKSEKSGKSTVLVTPIDQNSVVTPPQLPVEYGSLRAAPVTVEFRVLSSADVVNPKQGISILKLEQGAKSEYLQVIGMVGTRITALRLNSLNSEYPDPVGGSGAPIEWGVSSVNPVIVNICNRVKVPNVNAYDPIWSSTKYSVLRFFEIMGYSKDIIAPYLTPRYWGERFFSISSLNQSPNESGYALTTAEWPIEFNQPSTIISNTHTWAYCGYPFYSQGLPRYQTNDISKKLSYDFLSTATWSGRVTITGVNDKGELVSFGPQREAVTAQMHRAEDPETNAATQQIYIDQPSVEFPGQVISYTVDNISEQFDGIAVTFALKKGGLNIPQSHAMARSLWVQLGGMTQKPIVNYTTASTSITFSEAPPEGATCDIRVITSEDNEKTLVVIPLETTEAIDGEKSIYTLMSSEDISKLDINNENVIVTLGGVEQLPMDAYSISRVSPTQLQLTLTGVPPQGTTTDIRAICSGRYWSSQGVFPVAVYSLDDISPEFFNLGQTSFVLTYGGKPINPALVNAENLLVSLGGAMQVPVYSSGGNELGSYEVTLNPSGQVILKFREPPAPGSTCDVRIITNAETLPCLGNHGDSQGFLKWGPSLVVELSQMVESLMGG